MMMMVMRGRFVVSCNPSFCTRVDTSIYTTRVRARDVKSKQTNLQMRCMVDFSTSLSSISPPPLSLSSFSHTLKLCKINLYLQQPKKLKTKKKLVKILKR